MVLNISIGQGQPLVHDSFYQSKPHTYFNHIDNQQAEEYLSLPIFHGNGELKFKKNRLEDNPTLFFSFILIFSIILYTIFITPDYFRNLIFIITKQRYLIEGSTTRKMPFLVNNVILDLVFIAVTSLIIFLYQWEKAHFLYAEILLTIGGLYTIQVILSYIAYYVFFGSKYKNLHVANIVNFNRAFSWILVPVSFLIIYGFGNLKDTLFTVLLYFTLGLVVYRMGRTYIQIKKQYSFNALYILLYLCVFELSLYFIFIKEFYWLF